MNYLEARMEERLSIIGWLEAEAEDESLPSYANAYSMAATTLRNIVPTSEVFGLTIRPISVPDANLTATIP